MKDKLNLLFFKNVGRFLENEELEYLAILDENDNYKITHLPLVYNSYSSILNEYMCYDYDKLSEVNKSLYRYKYMTLKNIGDNLYKQDTKIYKKSL